MKRQKWLPLSIAAAILIQAAWYGTLTLQMVIHPNENRPTDFSIFYTAGRIANSTGYGSIYDLETQRIARQEFLGIPLETEQVLPFNHPPILVPVTAWIHDEAYMTTYWRWVAVMGVFLLGALITLDRVLRKEGWTTPSRWLMITAGALFYPVFVSFFKGQDSAVVLLGLMVWMYGLLNDKDWLAGAGLALTVLRPQLALVLAIPFLFQQRKVWWGFACGAAILSLYSLLLVGWTGVRDFIELMVVSAKGEDFGMYQHAMVNFTGLALRAFPGGDLEIIHGIAWGLTILLLIGLSAWWRSSSRIGLRHLVTAVTLSLFVAPHLHYHDLATLLVPCLGAGLLLQRSRNIPAMGISGLIMGVSVFLMVFVYWEAIQFTIPILVMAGLVLIAWRYDEA